MNINSYFKLIKSRCQKKVGLPKYNKNRKTNTTIPSCLVIEGDCFEIFEKNMRIPLSHKLRKRTKLKKFLIKYNGELRYKGKQCMSEIHKEDGKFYLYQVVELNTPRKQIIQNSIGIDLGIKRLITSISENNERLIIGSNRFFRQYQYYNKLIMKEKSYLETINRRSSNKLKKLFLYRKKYQKQLFDNVILKLFRFIKRNNIQQIFIGEVKTTRDSKTKVKIVNEMINNYWSFGYFYDKIESKAEELGIAVNRINESYTSRTCLVCGDKSKENCKDRDFICSKCNFMEDRDIVGASNILRRGMNNPNYKSVHGSEVTPSEVSI